MINAKLGAVGAEFDPLVYLLDSGSDRVGAIDFQVSATAYVPRAPVHAPLDQLVMVAEMIEAGEPIDEDLATALVNGTRFGGARPKALVSDDGVNMLAKFSRLADTFRRTQSEYVAWSWLAEQASTLLWCPPPRSCRCRRSSPHSTSSTWSSPTRPEPVS